MWGVWEGMGSAWGGGGGVQSPRSWVGVVNGDEVAGETVNGQRVCVVGCVSAGEGGGCDAMRTDTHGYVAVGLEAPHVPMCVGYVDVVIVEEHTGHVTGRCGHVRRCAGSAMRRMKEGHRGETGQRTGSAGQTLRCSGRERSDTRAVHPELELGQGLRIEEAT